jgi:Fe-S-cluster containining protein
MAVERERRMKKSNQPARAGGTEKRPAAMYAVTGEDLEARRAQRLGTVSILKTGRTSLQIVHIAEQADGVADEALAAAVNREPRRAPAACAEGCAWCCYQRVGVAVPEIVRIAEYLHATLSPHDRDATCARVEATLERRRLSRPTAPVPCPLLVNQRCSVYPVRPLTCRGFNSSDAALCESRVTTNPKAVVPVYPPQLRLTSLVLDGMRAGLTESKLKGDLLELAAGLHIALTRPDALGEWLADKPVFAPARLT